MFITLYIISLVLCLKAGSWYLFFCLSPIPSLPTHLPLITTNPISFLSVCLFLKYNWPTTLCYFLLYNIIIRYFYKFQNGHRNQSNFHLWHFFFGFIWICDISSHLVLISRLSKMQKLRLSVCGGGDHLRWTETMAEAWSRPLVCISTRATLLFRKSMHKS